MESTIVDNNNTDAGFQFPFETEYAVKLAEHEQERRLVDTEGEAERKRNALKVSQMFQLNLRSSWYEKGSTYVSEVVQTVKGKGNGIAESAVRVKGLAQKQASVAGSKFQEKTNQIQAAVAAIGFVGSSAVNLIQTQYREGVAFAGTKIQETFDKTGASVHQTLQQVSEGLNSVGDKLQQTFDKTGSVIQDTAFSTGGKLRESANNFAELASDSKEKLKEMADQAGSAWLSTVFAANRVYEGKLEEFERTRRMTNSSEITAVTNAFKLSSLIKGQGAAFYYPEFEPNSLYGTRILEEFEQKRRTTENTHYDVLRAKSVAAIIPKSDDNTFLLNSINKQEEVPAADAPVSVISAAQ